MIRGLWHAALPTVPGVQAVHNVSLRNYWLFLLSTFYTVCVLHQGQFIIFLILCFMTLNCEAQRDERQPDYLNGIWTFLESYVVRPISLGFTVSPGENTSAGHCFLLCQTIYVQSNPPTHTRFRGRSGSHTPLGEPPPSNMVLVLIRVALTALQTYKEMMNEQASSLYCPWYQNTTTDHTIFYYWYVWEWAVWWDVSTFTEIFF